MKHGEDDLCKALARWFCLQHPQHWPLFMHIPNGGQRSKRQGATFKAMGVKPGVPDYLLALPRGPHAGLWLEVKIIGGRLSAVQKTMLARLEDAGYAVATGYGFDECKKILADYVVLDPI